MKKVFALETTHHFYAHRLYEVDHYENDFVFIVNSWGTVTGHHRSHFKESFSIKEFVKYLSETSGGISLQTVLNNLPIEEDWNTQRSIEFFAPILEKSSIS